MNHAIRLIDIRNGDARNAPFLIGNGYPLSLLPECKALALNGLQASLATAFCNRREKFLGGVVAGNHMKSQHVCQSLLVFGLQKSIDCALRQSGKCRIGGREDCEGTCSLKCLDKAGGLDGGNEPGKLIAFQ